jgi:hypothetical protein
VTSLTAHVTGNSVALNWVNPAGTTGNRIYLNGVLRTNLATAASSATDTNAPSGWHTYNVSADNASGQGSQSNSVTVFIPAGAATTGPTSTTPTVGGSSAPTGLSASVHGTSVSLTWTNPSGTQSNHIYLNGILRTTLAAAATSYTDTNPPAGWHTYNVTASNATNEGPISNSVTVYIP